MKVNFNQSFKDFKQQVLMELGRPVMFSDQVCKTLFNLGTSSQFPVSSDDKYLAYKLCRRISEADGEVEISTEEGAFILKACADTLTAGAYGQLRELIDK